MQVPSLGYVKQLIKESSVSLTFVQPRMEFICADITKLPVGTDAEDYNFGSIALVLKPLEFFVLNSKGEWYNQEGVSLTELLQKYGLESATPEIFQQPNTGNVTPFYDTAEELPSPANLPIGLMAYVVSAGDAYFITTDKEWVRKSELEDADYPTPNSD